MVSKRSKGWIKLYGSIRESAVWSDPLRLKAWIDILLSANYQDREWFEHGQVHKVQRGQFITSIRKLGVSWNCSTNTVRRILKQFTELHMITHNSDTLRYTLITVVKYRDFQSMQGPEKHSDGYSDGYSDEHSDGHTDEYSDGYSDGIQHKNIKNNIDDPEREEQISPPPVGEADQYGVVPPGWTEEDEKSFLMMYEDNDWKTREVWAAHWKTDDMKAEGSDNG